MPNPKMKIWLDAAGNIKDAPDWFIDAHVLPELLRRRKLSSKPKPEQQLREGWDKAEDPAISLVAKLELDLPEHRIYLTRAEVSRWLQIPERTLGNWARKKDHPLKRYRVGKQRMYRMDNVRANVEGGEA